jgi:hypothetical protein
VIEKEKNRTHKATGREIQSGLNIMLKLGQMKSKSPLKSQQVTNNKIREEKSNPEILEN